MVSGVLYTQKLLRTLKNFYVRYEGAPAKPWIYFLNYVFILTCLKSSHLQNTLHLMQCTYWDVFSSEVKTSLTLLSFSASAIFVFWFHLFHISKTFLRTFFIQGNKKKVVGGEIRWIGRVGHGGDAVFGQKLLNTHIHTHTNYWTLSGVWADMLVNHPSWNGQTHLKSLQKNPLKPNTASHNNASWYSDSGGFLAHLAGEACTTRGPPSRIWFWGFLGTPPHTALALIYCIWK